VVGQPLAHNAQQGNTLRPRRFAATAMPEKSALLDGANVTLALLGATQKATNQVAGSAELVSGVMRGT
jgi:hypothetical protein